MKNAQPGRVAKPSAIIVDIDGTVALRGDRSPYDGSRVLLDSPNLAVISVVRALFRDGFKVIFVSGRMENTRGQTEAWLSAHVPVSYEHLYMRQVSDFRPDQQLKEGLYKSHIQDQYAVTCVIDDRQRVVEMWRRMGLTCLQVAPGDF